MKPLFGTFFLALFLFSCAKQQNKELEFGD
jgi:hypothetical protein